VLHWREQRQQLALCSLTHTHTHTSLQVQVQVRLWLFCVISPWRSAPRWLRSGPRCLSRSMSSIKDGYGHQSHTTARFERLVRHQRNSSCFYETACRAWLMEPIIKGLSVNSTVHTAYIATVWFWILFWEVTVSRWYKSNSIHFYLFVMLFNCSVIPSWPENKTTVPNELLLKH